MLRFGYILIVWLAFAVAVPVPLGGDQEEPPKHIDARAEFIRLIKDVKDGRKYVGLLVKIQGSREHLQLLIPLRKDRDGEWVQDKQKVAEARRLRRQQEINITYYVHDNRIWVHEFSPSGG
mgnify:CR=1 FL=1